MFLTLMVIGLAGLVAMALPALIGLGHGHGVPAQAHAGHAGHAGHVSAGDTGHGTQGTHAPPAAFTTRTLGLLKVLKTTKRGDGRQAHGGEATLGSMALRFLPSPRMIFSLAALYGASGNALIHAAHLRPSVAALVATIPALLVERFAVSPLWNLAFRFQGHPSSPMSALILEEVKAVTPFRNGRGVVAAVRDGRLVQFSAHLVDPLVDADPVAGARHAPQASQARQTARAERVKVGDRLVVEDVDSGRQHLAVSVPNRKV